MLIKTKVCFHTVDILLFELRLPIVRKVIPPNLCQEFLCFLLNALLTNLFKIENEEARNGGHLFRVRNHLRNGICWRTGTTTHKPNHSQLLNQNNNNSFFLFLIYLKVGSSDIVYENH